MFLRFCVFMILTVLAVVVAVLIGENGPWYFSWVLGTGFMILVASTGAILLDEQEESATSGTES